jgi:hypothetical protein
MERPSAISHLIQSISDKWTSWRERQRLAAEIAGCDSTEIERIATDLRLTPEELRTLATRDPNSADLLHRRLAAAGVSPKSIDGAIMRDLQRGCSGCDSKTECEKDLASGPVPSKWPSYCPNVQTIEAVLPSRCCCH